MFLFLCLLCLCARLFICALWSPAGKGLTSWFIPVSPTYRNAYSCYSHYAKVRLTYLYSIVCFRIILLLHSKSINFGISLVA